jgi:hypothetical protein
MQYIIHLQQIAVSRLHKYKIRVDIDYIRTRYCGFEGIAFGYEDYCMTIFLRFY